MRRAHLGHPAVSASMSNPLVFPFAFVVFLALHSRFLSCCRVKYQDGEACRMFSCSGGCRVAVGYKKSVNNDART